MPNEDFRHYGLSMAQLLKTGVLSSLARCITDSDGRPMTPDALFNSVYHEIQSGRDFVPIGLCNNWDPKAGCKGHDEEPDLPPDATPRVHLKSACPGRYTNGS